MTLRRHLQMLGGDLSLSVERIGTDSGRQRAGARRVPSRVRRASTGGEGRVCSVLELWLGGGVSVCAVVDLGSDAADASFS